MMMLSEAAVAMHGNLSGEDLLFESVEFDTRRVTPGALFFAIHGERENGHQYIAQAMQNKAVSSVVDEPFQNQDNTSHIRVHDTTLALGDLARHWRSRFDCPVVGITGSNGKTSVSQMLHTIFAEQLPGIAPQGSFNNHWGVPLTLLKLRKSDRSAVIEMGMNHAGELSYLGGIVRPNVALITNAAAAHLEGLGSVEGVALAKGELIDCVAKGGIVILNRDDAFYSQWRARAGQQAVISFGQHDRADVRIVVSDQDNLVLNIDAHDHAFEYALPGWHNKMNAAAAVAVSIAVGLSMDSIREGLARVRAVSGRLDMSTLESGLIVIDDSYNANQASMQAAIEVLSSRSGLKILVLGGMGELGNTSEQIHREIGAFAKSQGVDILLTLVDQSGAAYLRDMAHYLTGFGEQAMSFSNVSTLINKVRELAEMPTTVLVKGSRFSAMERVVEGLKQLEVQPC